MDKLKLAACGLDCNVCGLYNAGHDLKAAESIVEWFRGQGWIDADGNAEAVQKAVQDKKIFCDGCWGDGVWCGCGSCNLRTCCKQKEISHCGECSKFPCEPYKEFAGGHDGHKKAMEYLLSLNKPISGLKKSVERVKEQIP